MKTDFKVAGIAEKESLKSKIREFWDKKLCGSIHSDTEPGSETFYLEIERHRYATEFHIPKVAEFDKHAGEKALEIGGGLGTDGRQFAKSCVFYVDVDLSFESLKLAKKGFEIFGLRNGRFVCGDAENLPLKSGYFDFVYSHGVLHHTPDINQAIREIHRVLRPGGKAIIMLYHKHSYFYYVNIMTIRRLALKILSLEKGIEYVHFLTRLDKEFLQGYKKLAAKGFLTKQDLINQNTDGLGNPLSQFFTRKEVRRLFSDFSSVKTSPYYLSRRTIPLIGKYLPDFLTYMLGRLVGGFLYIKAIK